MFCSATIHSAAVREPKHKIIIYSYEPSRLVQLAEKVVQALGLSKKSFRNGLYKYPIRQNFVQKLMKVQSRLIGFASAITINAALLCR